VATPALERGTLERHLVTRAEVHLVRGHRGRVHVVDWTNPEAVRVMAEEYRRLFATGASVVKVDFGEELPAEAVYADGTPGERMHNLYPLRDQQAVHAATAAARGEREPCRRPEPARRVAREWIRRRDGHLACAGRHRVTVDGHPGRVEPDVPSGVELRA